MATGDLIYSGNHRVFALGQDQSTGQKFWWSDFADLSNPNGGAHFFLRDEGPDYGGPADAVNPFALNHTYTLAVYEGSIAAVSGAVYQRTFSVNGGVTMGYLPGAASASSTMLNVLDTSTPGGLAADDPNQSVNSVTLDVGIPLPVASQYTVVAVFVS